jgi:hypothetical protein
MSKCVKQRQQLFAMNLDWFTALQTDIVCYTVPAGVSGNAIDL